MHRMPGPRIPDAGVSLVSGPEATKYLFIGGPWDGRRIAVPVDTSADSAFLNIIGPQAHYVVKRVKPRPVTNGPDWMKYISGSTVEIEQFIYRRETLSSPGRVFFVYVHGDIDIIEKLVTAYPPPAVASDAGS